MRRLLRTKGPFWAPTLAIFMLPLTSAAQSTNADVVSRQSEAAASLWARHNRHVSLDLMGLSRRYIEEDHAGLTSNGVLNLETGSLPAGRLKLRWQTDRRWGPWYGAWAQATLEYMAGSTAYQGYLQYSNGKLVPYSASTHNIQWDAELRVGVVMHQTQTMQIGPYLGMAYHRWQRGLVQYTEHFDHLATQVGVMAQWQLAPRWTLEGDASVGAITHARMRAHASNLPFDQPLGNTMTWKAGVELGYAIAPGWQVTSGMSHGRWRHGQSALQPNGLQEPPSRTRQTQWTLGVRHQL